MSRWSLYLGWVLGSSLQHHRTPESPTPRSRKPKRKVDEMNGVSGHTAGSSLGHTASGEGDGESQSKKPRTDSGGWTTGRTSGSFMPYTSPHVTRTRCWNKHRWIRCTYNNSHLHQPITRTRIKTYSPNQISQDSIYNPSTTPSKQRVYGPPTPRMPLQGSDNQPPLDAAPVTPTRDHFEPPPQTSRFVDLLESAKQAKQERIARRRSAKAAKFGAGAKEAVITPPVVQDVDAAAACGQWCGGFTRGSGGRSPTLRSLEWPEVPPPPATPTAALLEPVNAVVLQQTTVVAAVVPTTTALAPAAIALIADVFGAPQQPGFTPPFSSSPAVGEDPQVTPPPAEQNADEEPVVQVAAETSWPSQIPGLGSGSGSAAGRQEGKGGAPVQQALEPPSTPLAPRIRAVRGRWW
ncbi:hypothetical protein BKA70DRAFT_741734 [Coprinopsis sp. MPI-PUGE-AT-0042]|nr:hypothetical protein BKA70DRAFT_741734 [Coprinopsis sp. MPI-PUGE-AT-0042]